jgi:hypothetical protein
MKRSASQRCENSNIALKTRAKSRRPSSRNRSRLGAWFEYASKRGVRCTGISNSQVSIDYLNRRAKQLGFDWELIKATSYSIRLIENTTRLSLWRH